MRMMILMVVTLIVFLQQFADNGTASVSSSSFELNQGKDKDSRYQITRIPGPLQHQTV